MSLFCACGAIAPVRAPAQEPAEDRGGINSVFCARVEGLGYELPYCPDLREWTRPSLISWREEAKAVALPSWAEVPEDVHALMEEIAPDEAREFFDLLFRWFLAPHEMTHFLQTEFRVDCGHALSEQTANDVAVAFWKDRPGAAAKLEDLRRHVENAVERLPLPAEAQSGPDQYFDRHYHELGGKPRLYGAFQFRFIARSLAREKQLDFAELINRMLGKGIDTEGAACRLSRLDFVSVSASSGGANSGSGTAAP